MFYNIIFLTISVIYKVNTEENSNTVHELIRKIHILNENQPGRISIDQLNEDEAEIHSIAGYQFLYQGYW